MLKLTSGGIDIGARPICDGREVDEEKVRVEETEKDGRRKAGMEAEGAEIIALSRPFDRAVESMVNNMPLQLEIEL